MSEPWELSRDHIVAMWEGPANIFPDIDPDDPFCFDLEVAHAAALHAREKTAIELFGEIEKLVAYSGDDAVFMTI